MVHGYKKRLLYTNTQETSDNNRGSTCGICYKVQTQREETMPSSALALAHNVAGFDKGIYFVSYS